MHEKMASCVLDIDIPLLSQGSSYIPVVHIQYYSKIPRDMYNVHTVLTIYFGTCWDMYWLFFPFPVPAYEVVKIHSARQVLRTRRKKRSSPFSSPIGETGEGEPWVPQTPYQEVHRVRVNTHGREFQLELEPNPHLLTSRQGGTSRLDAWYADGYKTNVTYSPGPKVRNIWHFWIY